LPIADRRVSSIIARSRRMVTIEQQFRLFTQKTKAFDAETKASLARLKVLEAEIAF
jgi:hypothetical protein